MSRLYDALQNAAAERPAEGRGAVPSLEVPVTRDPGISRLYQAIQGRLADRPAKVVQFVACGDGEGTSTVAAAVARLAAETARQSVLLLNVGARGSSPPLMLPRPPGMPIAAGEDGLPDRTAARRLFAANLLDHRGAEALLLNPPMLCRYWDSLRRTLDLVVIDTPPVARSPLALAVAPTVDGVVLIVQAEKTRSAVARAARDALAAGGANLLGVVLNRRRYYVPRPLYDWL